MHLIFVVPVTHLTREITNTLPTLFDTLFPQADFTITTADSENVTGKRPADSPDCIGDMWVF